MTDIRLAFRSLRATPVVTAVAVLSLALGIGANTAIFSLVNSLLLRALPVTEPAQLALVTDDQGLGISSWTNPIWDQIRSRRYLFGGAFAWSTSRFNLASGGETQYVDGISDVNRDLALTFRPLADQVDASLTQERVVAMLAGFFGALALLLAGLGLYGVTSYAVSRRRTEIGIRMALGAQPGSVIRLVLGRVTLLVAIGVAVGAGVSVWASKFVATLLYGLEPRDPLTLIAAAIVLGAVGAAAGWLPAYRASRIDPAEVLRDS